MDNIIFQDNNHHLTKRKDRSDLEWLNEFNDFLQGQQPEITLWKLTETEIEKLMGFPDRYLTKLETFMVMPSSRKLRDKYLKTLKRR